MCVVCHKGKFHNRAIIIIILLNLLHEFSIKSAATEFSVYAFLFVELAGLYRAK